MSDGLVLRLNYQIWFGTWNWFEFTIAQDKTQLDQIPRRKMKMLKGLKSCILVWQNLQFSAIFIRTANFLLRITKLSLEIISQESFLRVFKEVQKSTCEAQMLYSKVRHRAKTGLIGDAMSYRMESAKYHPQIRVYGRGEFG